MARTVQTLLIAAVLAASRAAPAAPATPRYGAPAPPGYGAPAPPSYDHYHAPYAFEYAVNDRYTGAAFSQAEESSGAAVRGSYSVALPDGRIQHVTYVADHAGGGGYNARVTYEGAAHHPAPVHGYSANPAQYHARPAHYEPAPALYRPEPASYESEPASYGPEPASYDTEPASYEPEPAPYQLPLEPYKP